MKNKALLSLGSNIEPRAEYLKKTINIIEEEKKCLIIRISKILDNPPILYTNQNNFLNQIIEVKTSMDPFELLAYCKNLEKRVGRKERFRYGPREIDIDILYYENIKVKDENLIIPHPGTKDREYLKILLQEFDLKDYEKINT